MDYDYKYSHEKKVDIGRLIYTHLITGSSAMKTYEISKEQAIKYVKFYQESIGEDPIPKVKEETLEEKPNYQEMTKEQLIKELMKKDIEVARAKKGYAVTRNGKTKEFNILKNPNSK